MLHSSELHLLASSCAGPIVCGHRDVPGLGIGTRMDVEQFRIATRSMRLPLLASLALAALMPVVVAGEPGDEVDAPWKQHAIDQGLDGGDGVRLDDADGDGDLDVAVGWEQAGISRLYLNPGAGKESKKRWPKIDVGPARRRMSRV